MSRLRRPFRKGSKGYLLQNRKGTTLRQDLGKGASDIRRAFKKIKNEGKSLTRGTTDLSATRVLQGPAAGSDLIVAARKIASRKQNEEEPRKQNEEEPRPQKRFESDRAYKIYLKNFYRLKR